MEQKTTREWKGEMLVSTRKIWCNIKKYWILGAAVLVICAVLVGLLTFREYRADLASAAMDTYQGQALVYIDSGDEDYSDAYSALLYSERIREQVNEALLANGFEEFDKNLDTANVDMSGTSMCYRVIVRSIGLERTQFLAQEYTRLLLEEAREIMGLRGELIDEPVMTTYMTRANGSVEIFELDEPRTVTLSLSSFLSWNKIMIIGAGVFLWCAFVAVKVFYDCTLRSREEMDQISPVPCFCEIQKGDRESARLLAALLDAVGEQTQKRQILLIAPGAGKGLTAAFDAIQEALKERKSGVGLEMAAQAAVSADSLDQARDAQLVYLFASVDEDDANETDRAFANLSTVGAELEGYIISKPSHRRGKTKASR